MLAYFAATLLIGALLAPPLFWAAQWLAAHQIFAFLAGYDFEKFFHRALLIAALLLLWPLLRSLKIRSWSELGLQPNEHRSRDLLAGFLLAHHSPALLRRALAFLWRLFDSEFGALVERGDSRYRQRVRSTD